jgi:hypothetical protein
MKNIKLIAGLFLIFTSFTFTSCDIEPIDSAIDLDDFNPVTSVSGSYLMTAFNTSIPTDLNNDGVASANQMNETTCFDGSILVLNQDNTFVISSKGIDIVTDGVNQSLSCFMDPNIMGTWILSGNTLTIQYTEGGSQYSEQFIATGNTLVYTLNNTEIVGTSSTNVPVNLTSDISIIYTKG